MTLWLSHLWQPGGLELIFYAYSFNVNACPGDDHSLDQRRRDSMSCSDAPLDHNQERERRKSHHTQWWTTTPSSPLADATTPRAIIARCTGTRLAPSNRRSVSATIFHDAIYCLHWLRKTTERNFLDEVRRGYDNGMFNPNDTLHISLFNWLWPPICQAILDDFVAYWNSHRAQTQRNKLMLSGATPRDVFTSPQAYGGERCSIPVPQDAIDALRKNIPINFDTLFALVTHRPYHTSLWLPSDNVGAVALSDARAGLGSESPGLGSALAGSGSMKPRAQPVSQARAGSGSSPGFTYEKNRYEKNNMFKP
ncbi:hypothetical protein JB92DRAFT_2832928 [Gautieria morchelliformis]|nr:hypothetical protein JB92DRAFT_2832928 [Gautieria morchelliformis]